jgi:hypothetical protein
MWTVTAMASGEIGGQVTLAKGLTAPKGGVLYVFAKKAGTPMPVAVVRFQEPQFPLKFTMSEKNAMAPGTPFEGPFTVTARYSPSGDAMDKSGPEATLSKPVAVGDKNLKLELKAKAH